MPSRPVPRIRVDLPDGSPCGLSPSSTLDIKDVLCQAKLLPKLLAEHFVFDDADDALYFEDGRLQDFPSFPMRRQPRFFILDSHRARLPFLIRPDAFEMGDFCWDKDAVPLLTAPTVPRMKMMMKEPLYVQKWVDALTPENPPKHIPWACEKPAVKKKWIAEGSIFPVDVVKSDRSSTGQCGAIQERSDVTGTVRLLALVDQGPHSRALCALPEASDLMCASTESHTSTPHIRIKSADVDSGTPHGESKTSHTPQRIVRASQASVPPTLLLASSPIGTTPSTPNAPLAARRGKSISGLNLQACFTDHLEYPDIPTAFRGSPIVWSPRCDIFPVPSFTDHESMVLDLKSKCVVLGSGISAYIQEPLGPQTELTCTSLSIDEWAFTRGFETFDISFLGSIDNQALREITADTSIFLPRDSSTPVKGPTVRLGCVHRPHSTPALQSPAKRSSDPPGAPLPPRPALINPSTPPHVRGILKKVKSVRFEDMTTRGLGNRTSLVIPPSQTSSKRPSSLPAVVSPVRPCTPIPRTAKPSSGPAPVKEALRKNVQRKSALGSRLPPKRAKADGKSEPTPCNVGNAPEPSNPTSATTPVERPCRIARAKENTNSTAVSRVQAKQKALPIAETDVRRGIEGNTKSRLSTPLRNIFRFR